MNGRAGGVLASVIVFAIFALFLVVFSTTIGHTFYHGLW